MRATSWLLAACAAAIAGAFGGAALDPKPVSHRTDVLAKIPRHDLPVSTAERHAPERDLPDHYPLVTPDGVVEVAELAMHGRFRHKLDTPVYNFPGYSDAPIAFAGFEPPEFDYRPSKARFERPERLAHAAPPERLAHAAPPELHAAAAAAIAVSAEAAEAARTVSGAQAAKSRSAPVIVASPSRAKASGFAGAVRTSPE